MTNGFRKTLFGFHCGDVMEYIEGEQQKNVEHEKELNDQIEALKDELLENENVLNGLKNERDALAQKIREYNEKYEEIEKLSENIGKLYLVSQANAQAIMNNSAENSHLVDQEIDRNIAVIDRTHQSLDDVKDNMLREAEEFSRRIADLIGSLDDAKKQIAVNQEDTKAHQKNFQAVFSSIE